MKNRAYKKFILTTITFTFAVIIAAAINNNTLAARAKKPVKVINTKEKTTAAVKKSPEKKDANPVTSIEITPEVTPIITDLKTPEVKDEKSGQDTKAGTPGLSTENTPVIIEKNIPEVIDEKKTAPVQVEQSYIKAAELSAHPEIILNAYKKAYPDLITDVIKGENDWLVKFANGNIYYWAEGKILPESQLPDSKKYTGYSIYAYNLNGRSPELYTEEMIEKLRIKKPPVEKKKKIVPGEQGGFYKELFGVTTKKSVKKLLVEVKLSGHYIIVHNIIAKKIRSIDSKIKILAKSDPEVLNFVKKIKSVEAFNWRKIAGTDRKSNHSYGIAIDILPKKYRKKTLYWLWEGEKNEKWMLLPQSSLWTPPDKVVKIFLEEGFIWGGHWDRYDTMHFEYRPELIHLFNHLKFE